jgi:hypothetical protein
VLLAAVAVLGMSFASPGTASADLVGQTITADLNGDGVPDHATLGQVGTTNSCTVTVQHGIAAGGFGSAHVHTYTSPEALSPFCPDIGVAVKLGSHKKFDLVTGFSFGGQDVLVLHKFQPAGTYSGLVEPSFFRTADLNGDGRQDIIEGSSQVSGLRTFLNSSTATLTAGPIGECVQFHGSGPQYVLADFNGDGGQDMLLSSFCIQQNPAVRAEVLFGNGQTKTILDSTNDSTVSYVVFQIDLDYNGIPDAGVIQTAAGVTTVRYFHNNGAGAFTEVAGP